MLTRREILLGLGSGLVSAASGAACKRSESSTSSASTTPSWPRKSVHEGVEMLELFPREADEKSPLIIFIHGMGGRPEPLVDHWRTFPSRVHIALPRAFDSFGTGYSWFEFKDGMTDEQFGEAVSAAETRLWKGIAKLAGTRRPIVSGFSQGGILSFAIASRHPDVVSHAFPVAGSCPGPLLPKNKSRAAPLLAFHGTEDNVLQLKWGREAVQAFKDQGNDAEIKEYAGVGHTMTPEIKKDLWDAIARAL